MDCLPHVLPTLTALVNLSVVCQHLKDGDHKTPNNNRPISFIPVLSKVTEKIALNQFNDFLIQQGNLNCHQSGNRKYHPTETLSLLVAGHIFKAMYKKEVTAMVLIDLGKAFDSICHTTLLPKLQGLGASSKASKWFESYLTDRMHSTRLGTSRSEEQIGTHGVPQGSILGLLLFSLYMNDLRSVSSVESYVDDTKVYLSFSCKDIDCCLTKVTEDLCLIAA